MAKKFMTKSEKLEKAVGDNFAEEFRSAADERVKDKIVDLSKEIEKQLNDKRENQKLIELAAQRSALSGGYNDLIKKMKTEIKFLLDILESRGKL
jgi:hypothetical protein